MATAPGDPVGATQTLRPGMQTDWVGVGGPFPSWLDRLPDDSTSWVAHPVGRGYSPATALCSVDAPVALTYVSGDVSFVDNRCPGAALVLSGLDVRRQRRLLGEVRSLPSEKGHFELQLDTRDAGHLLMELVSYSQGSSIDYCLLKVRLKTSGPRSSAD
jgi:hypothetical protein